ncbi:MAG: N-acetylglucosamine-6-phosphate deacetylase [Pyrinomonadaceae bacterium]
MRNDKDKNESLLLRGARVVLPRSIIEHASVLLEDGRIARISEDAEATHISAGRIFELNGLTLFPGFIDLHIHGAVGVDTMEATAVDLHLMAQFLARNGVTAWLPTLVPAPDEDYKQAARAIEELIERQDEIEPAARAVGLHYEGPFINSAQCGALRPPFFRKFIDKTEVDALAIPQNNEAARMITVAPEIEGGIELVHELKRRGWIVSIGHTRATIEILDRACEAGAHHMTHFMNAMSPLHHRAPGPIGWGLFRDDVTCDVIADGVHSDPLMLRLALKCKTAERLALISDAVAPTGLGDGEYKIWGEAIAVEHGRTRNERGSIAGSVITMLDAARMMLSLGVSQTDVARMASTNPARLLRLEKETGSIEEGKRADLVALDTEGEVRLTLIGGRVAFEESKIRV